MTGHYQNPYLPHTLRGAAPKAVRNGSSKAAKLTVDAVGLPIGTAAQVLEWVGDDPDRAQRFLTKEQLETRPRVTLVSNLKAVLKRHEILPEEVAPPEPPTVVQDEVIADDEDVNQLDLIRERLKVE